MRVTEGRVGEGQQRATRAERGGRTEGGGEINSRARGEVGEEEGQAAGMEREFEERS